MLSQADVLVHPSHQEGLPGVVLEAAAVGTPVVACDLPGARFVQESFPTVRLVDVDAAAPAWAQAVSMTAIRPGRSRDVEAALRRFQASVFCLEKAAAANLAVYQRGTTAARR